jgi:pimeloyl-ACP methyl ester carboxylesterase
MQFTYKLIAVVAAAFISLTQPALAADRPANVDVKVALSNRVHYRSVDVDGVKVFYREAGNPANPTLLLLHGFGATSFMFRDLMPVLADRYHPVAPDLPGFGFTEVTPAAKFTYNFDSLAKTIDAFTDRVGVKQYGIYVFDFGAPVGWRLAVAHPERITAIITQNGNAYLEGLSEGWSPIQAYWKSPTEENRAALKSFFLPATTNWQYNEGEKDKTLISPDSQALADLGFAKLGNQDIQLDLFLDYANNVKRYPEFQAFSQKSSTTTRGMGQK